ncbi:MAG: PA14 domain-containing protein, partial [Kiritimatiellaeota bacterium]|nr:PA14 domain-containing protein [Kiritimatiellota bacterium]
VSQSAGGVFSGNLQGPASAEIVKGGAGTWKLDGCGSIYEGTFYQTGGAGQTTLEGVSILGGVRVDTGTAIAFDPPASDGLMGYYYIGNPTASSNSFLTLAGMEAYFAGRRPALIRPSGLDGPNFDYTGAADFPYPFGHGGPNPTEFSAVWRGSITVPETGTYSFGAWVDDFTLLAIDGTVLHAANSYIATFVFSTIDLTAGRHDFLFAMGQGAGGVIARLQVCLPSQTVHQALPNSWFSPMPTVGALDAAGPVALHGNANVSVGLRGVGSLSGGLSVGAGGLFEKSGEGTFDLGGGAANQILGDMSVLGGVLNILPPNLLGAQNYLTLYDGAMFRTEEPQTVTGLRGKGGITVLGNGADAFAFTDETDCGISTEKNYTHLVNFPLSPSAFSTVNGVAFDTRDAGWSWGAGIPPPLSLGNSTEDGVAGLLGGFLYNSQNYTIRLTGLAPFTAHEFRFYFRNYGTLGSPRNVAFTFSVGGAAVGTARHNLDGMTRSQVRCRYVTDAAGTLDVHVLSLNPDMCHLYAFSNENLGTAGSGATGPVLTVMSPAGADTRYEGSLGGPGALVKDGPGIQRFGSAISLEGGLTVLAGEAVLASGANLKGTTEVAAGAALSAPYGAVTLSGLSGGGTFHMGGAGNFMPNWIYLHPITNDVSSLISPTKVYTHKLDFGSRVGTTIGGPGATVNGVEFVKAGPGGSSGSYGWSGFQTGTNPGGTPAGIASDQGMHALLTDMVNANNTPGNPQIATLTGLTPGKQYEVRFYNRAWTADAARYQTVIFMPGGSVSDTVNFNVDGLTPHFLAYRYTPVSSELTISIDGHGSNESWHIYALTNEEYDGQDDEECLLHGITPGVPYTATYPVETLYQHFFTDDATSQISPLKCYTHALDFGSRGGMPLSLPGAVVNGVQFTKAGSNGAMNGYGWTGFGNANNVGKGGNTGTTSDQGVYGLLTDFVFNQVAGTARLTGLTPGKQYEVRIYLRAWNLNGNRPITLNFSADPAVTHSISFMEDNIPTRFVAYRYTPTSTTLTIQYNALSGDTWHIYALTNEEANDQTTSPVVLDTAEDAVFSGTVTGHGMWVKRGAGALTMTGVNTATGPLTVDGGAFGVGADGIATLGPVSVQGGLLFGQGTVGGAVHVAPGVWIQGGTADACGTLTTGGDLVIEEGVNIKYRYASSSVADTFIVNGVLTLPNDGVVYTQPFTVGARPPAKWLLFDSPNAINGPADLSGWVVDGIPSAKLTYGPGKTRVYLNAPSGTMLMIR